MDTELPELSIGDWLCFKGIVTLKGAVACNEPYTAELQAKCIDASLGVLPTSLLHQ